MQERAENINILDTQDIIILKTIKTHPSKIGLEELRQKTKLTQRKINESIKNLIEKEMVVCDSRFPSYPENGWKVYTNSNKKEYIDRILDL